ncbi:polysaccharide biosynthesis protein [Candidatus Magnetaquicoccus inordinatus]|uniref:polysaccharide biosynthesis protein n=1 Tax=Candidatus Magnetaquicoccus inordinatus TaxID=2496818 RepID=UPI00187D5EF8|nr:polysaccharide biosynthesis protein [Candidatus Magnetaquicoccus inordinatus]
MTTQPAADLLVQLLKRRHSLLQADREQHAATLRAHIQNARILVVGAAGSIGSAFVEQLVQFYPAALHLLDPSENNLVELVRTLRSGEYKAPEDFATFAIAMGTPEFHAFLSASSPYQVIVNFAALKHVRSERDPFTLMRLIHTNIVALDQFLLQLSHTPPQHFFSVSSDKAVEPENAMGASKAGMEAVLWQHAEQIPVSSARFANVAFSDGSLLHGFIRRWEKRQPLAAPNDVRRYFLSPQEGGELCLLACFLANNREIFIPRLHAEDDLHSFAEIAQLFLHSQGVQPHLCQSEEEARAMAAQLRQNPTPASWPCLFTPSDTSGEKMVEIFAAADETIDYERFNALGVISKPPFSQKESLRSALAQLQNLRQRGHWQSAEIMEILQQIVPTLRHKQLAKNLDQKM